jgi:uncharacterized membrane protein
MATTEEAILAEEEAHVEGLDGTGSDMSRVVGMSDAVFAFSMTFLVITLVLPQVGATGKYPNLVGYLQGEWPSFVAYLISFFVIASWWGAHRRLFSPIIRYDELLVRLNNFFLLVIAVTPFLVGILYDYGPGNAFVPSNGSTVLAVVIFASAQVVGGLVLLGIWHHSTQDHRLVEPNLPAAWIQRTERLQLSNVAVFAISIPVAFLDPFVAMVMWIIVIVGLGRTRAKHTRRHRRPHRTAAEAPASRPLRRD